MEAAEEPHHRRKNTFAFAVQELEEENGIVRLDLSALPPVDAQGMRALIERCKQWKKQGVEVRFSGTLKDNNAQRSFDLVKLQELLEGYCASEARAASSGSRKASLDT